MVSMSSALLGLMLRMKNLPFSVEKFASASVSAAAAEEDAALELTDFLLTAHSGRPAGNIMSFGASAALFSLLSFSPKASTFA